MTGGYLEEDLARIANVAALLGLSGSTFYVSGASGLVGSTLARGLLRHNELSLGEPIAVLAGCRDLAACSRLLGQESDELSFVVGDLRDGLSLPCACDYAVHAACPTASRGFVERPVEVMMDIVCGTRAVLEASRACGAKGVLYVSSMEAFGQVAATGLSAERDLGYVDLSSVRSCYPEGKRAAELLCRCYFEEYGLPVKVARLAQAFGAGVGPSEGRVFAQFARSAVEGREIVLRTDGGSMGNYCYLADAVAGMLTILAKGGAGETYNVSNEAMTMTVREMAELVAEEVSEGRSRVVVRPEEGEGRGYAAKTGLRMRSDRLRGLGWEPTFGMAEAYRRMVPDLKGE